MLFSPGMTLLELTAVILVLLSLITILFIGAKAWKRGSDRALCIMNIQHIQKGVRSYANMYGFQPGANAPNLKSEIVGMGRFVESTPVCPGGGSYTFGAVHGADTVPPLGTVYMECTLGVSDEHVPPNTADW
jgi:type II secretory pathway pseudopilin PulG